MYSSGHVGVSAILYAPILFALLIIDPFLAVSGLLIVLFLSSTPDIDVIFHFKTSKIYKLPLIGPKMPTIKHRGITHSVWFMLLFGVILSVLSFIIYPQIQDLTTVSFPVFAVSWFMFGFIGIFGHVIGDMITPSGINLLYPYGGPAKSITFHSKNKWFIKLRSYSNQKQTNVRENGILTVASNELANYIANILGLSLIAYSFIVFYVVRDVYEVSLLHRSALFIASYIGVLSIGIIIFQRTEVKKYIL